MSGINPLQRSSDIADKIAESLINKSGRVHPSLRSVAGSEGTGSRVVDSMVAEGEGTEGFEVSGASPLRDFSDVADSLAESPIVMFGDQGNSLQNNSETEGVGCCD